jgi:hypothetical protein
VIGYSGDDLEAITFLLIEMGGRGRSLSDLENAT